MKWLLGIIVLLAFTIRVYNLNYNTPFVDEAMYVTVGLQILGGDLASGISASSWVGGFPYVYPLATAFFYEVGGIIGSRFFTVILGTLCVYLMYQFTKQLLIFKDKKSNEIAGLVAAAFTTVTTIAVTTSRLAIYDGLAFTLFFAGIILLHKAIYSGERKLYLISAVILFLSFLAKYIVLIYFPFIILLPIIVAIKLHKKEYLKDLLINFCLPLCLMIGIYAGLNFDNLREFLINQGVVSKASEVEITRLFLEYTEVEYVLLFVGMFFLWRINSHLLMLLLFFSFIPLIVHSLTGNSASISQHTFLSLLFVMPVVGAFFAHIIRHQKRLGLLLTAVALFIQILVSIPQTEEAEGFWPNITEAVKVIEPNVDSNDRILAESGDSLYLMIKNKVSQEQVVGPFVFEYDGSEGIDAYTKAIEDGYFTFIQLEGTYFSEEDIQAILSSVDLQYTKVYDDGSVKVYKLNE